MKVFVQLGAAVLAALAIVPTPGTEGAAISYGKRGFAPESFDSYNGGAAGYGLRKRPFCNAFDGCGGKKRSDPSLRTSPEIIQALAGASGGGVDDIEALLLNGAMEYANTGRVKRSAIKN